MNAKRSPFTKRAPFLVLGLLLMTLAVGAGFLTTLIGQHVASVEPPTGGMVPNPTRKFVGHDDLLAMADLTLLSTDLQIAERVGPFEDVVASSVPATISNVYPVGMLPERVYVAVTADDGHDWMYIICYGGFTHEEALRFYRGQPVVLTASMTGHKVMGGTVYADADKCDINTGGKDDEHSVRPARRQGVMYNLSRSYDPGSDEPGHASDLDI